MARVEITRFTCAFCDELSDVPSSSHYPANWKEYAIRQTGPVEQELGSIVDLCPKHVTTFQDHMYGQNGPHRNLPAKGTPHESSHT